MNEKAKINIPLRLILFGLTAFFLIIIGISLLRGETVSSVQSVLRTAILPMQKGVNTVGTTVADSIDDVLVWSHTQKENAELQEQVDALQTQLNLLENQQTKLKEYEKLLDLKEQYPDYDMIGANVIAKDPGNWFHTFIIDKGLNDGLAVDMVVLAQGGLAGIITSIGPTSAKVMAIIDDDSNVTATVSNSKAGCMISGDLELYEEGRLRIMYLDKDDEVNNGDAVVTSNISTKYLPGILIGHVDEVEVDSNNMTKSGTIIPAVDFESLDTVMVVTTLKNTGEDSTASEFDQ
jgi:rod shape-determining protein MreC